MAYTTEYNALNSCNRNDTNKVTGKIMITSNILNIEKVMKIKEDIYNKPLSNNVIDFMGVGNQEKEIQIIKKILCLHLASLFYNDRCWHSFLHLP